MKKLFVFGASGGTGKHVVRLALQNGMKVTALVRNPEVFPIHSTDLTVIKGDVLEPGTFRNALAMQDAVISCLGIPKIRKTTLYSAGMRNIVECMEEVGIHRILCISSGALDIPPGSSFIMNFLLKNVLQRMHKPIYADMRRMEQSLKNSALDWTIVRAPKLTDGKETGHYRTITGQPLKGIPKITRADLAHYMLGSLADKSSFQRTIDIAN